MFQLLDGTQYVAIQHNTAFEADSIVFGERAPHTGFVFSGNIVTHGEYGIIGSGFGVGFPSLSRYFPDAVVERNVIVGGRAGHYPPDNYFPGSLDDVGFMNRTHRNYRLDASSRYARAANDGGDIGVNFNSLSVAMGPGWAEFAASATWNN